MKCESKISRYCKKVFKKSEVKYIWDKGKPIEVCSQCFWLLKQRVKKSGNGGNPNGRPKQDSTSKPSLTHRKSKIIKKVRKST